MRWAILHAVLFLLFCTSISLPASTALPGEAQTLTIDGSITASIIIQAAGPHPSVANLVANISWFPKDRKGQTVTFLETTPQGAMSEEDIAFTLNHPGLGEQSFTIDYQVRTQADATPVSEKVAFPLPPLPSSITPYLSATQTIDQTQGIKRTAADIAGDEDDVFIVVTRLASWTKQNVEYDLSTASVEASQPASWVLENREGVCDEMTNLFIAFCRSLGIPARFVSGIAYTNDPRLPEGWGAHGWAEVYLPTQGWIPFDVAYGQYGWVDATHIVFKEGIDGGKYASSYSWMGRDIDLDVQSMTLDASAIDEGKPLEPLIGIAVGTAEEEVAIGSYQLIIATVGNEQDRYVAEEVTLGGVEGMDILDDATQMVILAPGEQTTLYWRIKLDSLDRDYLYTFPVSVYAGRDVLTSGSFQASSSGKMLSASWVALATASEEEEQPTDAQAIFSCIVASGIPFRPHEQVTVTCTLTNDEKDPIEAQVCLEEQCKEVRVAARTNAVTEFTTFFTEPSLYALSFTASSSRFEKRSYVSVEVVGKSTLSLSTVNAPASLAYDEEGTITFSLAHESGPPAHNVTVTLANARTHQDWTFSSLESEQRFSVTTFGRSLSMKDDLFTLTVTYRDERGEENVLTQTFTIPLRDLKWWQRILLAVQDWFS